VRSDIDIVQGGVTCVGEDPGRIPTKKRLKQLVASEPTKVMFYATSQAGGPHYRGSVAQLPLDIRLVVVGPNPQNARDWYAEIFWKNGKLKVT
jgi:hypothetical protein